MNRSKSLDLLRRFVFASSIGLLITGTALHSVQAQSVACAEEVVMQRGQSLASIAAQAFGTQDAVDEIIAATNAQAEIDPTFATISDPDLVEVGWKICVPVEVEEVLGRGGATLSSGETTERMARTVSSKGVIATRLTRVNAKAAPATSPVSEVPLEQNESLMASLMAERLGDDDIHPLSIEYLRRQEYSSSPLTIEATLPGGDNYQQYLVSYQSEGLTLYAAMSVPEGEKPEDGWPVVVFIHGYIEPSLYSPTERYTEFIDALAGNSYIVLRPDLRGHGDSEGEAYGAYGDPGYTIDLLNALASIQRYPDVDPNRIGLFGHSMGGYLAARAMVVSDQIKAGVIWGGVVAPYEQLVAEWRRATSTIDLGEMPIDRVLLDTHGTPQENPNFWVGLSANSYVADLSGPVQLHHGTADAEVPVAFSDQFYADIIAVGEVAEYYLYPGDDHNITAGFENAMRRSLDFLDTYVKGIPRTPTRQPSSAPVQTTS